MLFGSCEEANSCGPPTESEQNGNVPRRRLAVALLFEEPVALELLTLRSAVGSPSLDRVPPHITLIPPINVPASQMDAVMALLRQSAGVIRAFKARIGPVETFSPVTPVLYLSVSSTGEEIRRLQERLSTGPFDRVRTYPFVPHVTLHEAMSEEELTASLLVLKSFSRVVTFSGVDLLEEESDRVWRTIAHVPFRRTVASRWSDE